MLVDMMRSTNREAIEYNEDVLTGDMAATP
jgi:hypothetical protein